MVNILCKIIEWVENFFLMIFEKIGLKIFSDWYRKHQEGMRYLVFGFLSTIVNIVIFAIFANIVKFSTTFSNVIAWVGAVSFAYITNKLFVFYSKSDSIKDLFREIIIFFGARIFTLIVETIFLNITIDYYNLNSIIMKIISNIIVIILNFIFSKLFVFKKSSNRKGDK